MIQEATKPNTTKPFDRVAASFATTLVLFVACFIIIPAGLASNAGLSFYGVKLATVVFYTLALLLYAVTLTQVGRILAHSLRTPRLSIAFNFMAVCLVGLIVTPYSFGLTFYAIHDSFGTTLFATQFATAIWLTYKHGDHRAWLLVAIQFMAGLTALLSLPNIWQLELYGQVVFQIAFATILLRQLRPSTNQAS